MKKNFILPIAILSTFLFSCGDAENKNATDSAGADTMVRSDSAVADTMPKIFTALLLGGDTIEPTDASLLLYRFDQKLIKEDLKPFSVKEVRSRFMPVDTACDEEASRELVRFFYLDSMNRAGNDSYMDIGQTIKVEIRVIDTIPVSNAFTTVAWTIYYSTYEACPFSAGTYYMISTYSKNGKLASTQLMGMKTGGGDAPYGFSSDANGNLYTDGSYKICQVDTTDDGDAPEKSRYEITRRLFRGYIKPGGTILKEEITTNK